ncbi:C-type lectin-2 [Aphelenchoides avenae]|nr:C-type lectin-2 [Aphelenchus avenae]
MYPSVPILFVLLAEATSAFDGQCSDGWRYLQQTCSCYKLNGNGKPLTWREAHRSCVVAGGDLISIHSKEEQDLAYELGKSAGVSAGSFGSSGIWIGFRRENALNAQWGWSDGSPVDFKNFAPAQPDNSGGQEFCVDLLTMVGLNGQWNDYDCSGSKPPFGAVSYAICKQAADGCHASSSSPSKSTTEPTLHASTTHARSPSTVKAPLTAAEPVPPTVRTEPATPAAPTKTGTLPAVVPSSVAATTTSPHVPPSTMPHSSKAMSTTPKPTAKHPPSTVGTSHAPPTATTRTPTKAGTLKASSVHGLSSVAAATTPPHIPPSTGLHSTKHGPTSKPSEKQRSSSGTTPGALPTASTATPIKCDNGMIIKNSFAYFWHEGPRDFWTAEKDCQRCGGHLVSLHSGDEAGFVNLNFVSKLAERYVWGGLYDAANGTKFPRQWTNTDGTPYDFWVWQPGQPDNYMGAESCMAYENGKYGTWDDVPCGYKSKYSICKKGPVKIV